MAPVHSLGGDVKAVDETAQLLATILTSGITIAAVIATLLFCRRTGVGWPVLILISGGGTFLLEPLFDHLYGLWFFEENQVTAITTYGISIPVWLPIVYVTYYGAWTVFLRERFTKGATVKQVAGLFLASVALAAAFEQLYIQIFELDVYRDSQPLYVTGDPVWVAVVNGVPPFLAAIVLVRLVPLATGWYRLSLLGVVPAAFAADSFGTGWLYLAARHSGEAPPMWLLTCLALLTVAACFGTVLTAAKLAGIHDSPPGVRWGRVDSAQARPGVMAPGDVVLVDGSPGEATVVVRPDRSRSPT
jgi:hypothetical protein